MTSTLRIGAVACRSHSYQFPLGAVRTIARHACLFLVSCLVSQQLTSQEVDTYCDLDSIVPHFIAVGATMG